MPRTVPIGQEATLVDSNGNKVAHTYLLRKFNFSSDITSGLVSAPQVSRTVEVLARPNLVNPFNLAMTLKSSLNMSGGGIIDSFNSSNPLYSTGGLYDSTKRQSNATVGSLSTAPVPI